MSVFKRVNTYRRLNRHTVHNDHLSKLPGILVETVYHSMKDPVGKTGDYDTIPVKHVLSFQYHFESTTRIQTSHIPIFNHYSQ